MTTSGTPPPGSSPSSRTARCRATVPGRKIKSTSSDAGSRRGRQARDPESLPDASKLQRSRSMAMRKSLGGGGPVGLVLSREGRSERRWPRDVKAAVARRGAGRPSRRPIAGRPSLFPCTTTGHVVGADPVAVFVRMQQQAKAAPLLESQATVSRRSLLFFVRRARHDRLGDSGGVRGRQRRTSACPERNRRQPTGPDECKGDAAMVLAGARSALDVLVNAADRCCAFGACGRSPEKRRTALSL